jgi:hypothetical protein
MTTYYAGIGSRQTPDKVLDKIYSLGYYFALINCTLRSGHAIGADRYFESGCDDAKGSKEIYKPTSNVEDHIKLIYPYSIFVDQLSPEAKEIAKSIHPNWNALSNFGKKAHTRNVAIVLGKDLRTPSDFLICWTENAQAVGGSATAINVAMKYDIPVFNLGLRLFEDMNSHEIFENIVKALDFSKNRINYDPSKHAI